MTERFAQHPHRLSSRSLVARTDTIIDAEVNGEVIALSVSRGTCYGLSKVGSRIWKLLVSPTQISDLCAPLLEQYDVDPNVCEQQVLDFLEELRSEGLITTRQET